MFSSKLLLRDHSRISPNLRLSSIAFVRLMGGGPRTFHDKKSRDKEKKLLDQEKQLYQARIRSQINEDMGGRGNNSSLGKYDRKTKQRLPLKSLENHEYLSEHVGYIREEFNKRKMMERSQAIDEEESILSEKKFEECDVSPLTVKALTEAGFVQMTRVQEATISVGLEGNDALVKAKTGTGKTAAFLIPAIETVLKASATPNKRLRVLPIYVLVPFPTRELASQIAAEANAMMRYHEGIGVQTLVGGTRFKLDQKRLESEPCQNRVLQNFQNVTLISPAVYTSVRSGFWSSFHLQHPHFGFPNPMIPMNVFHHGSLQGRIRLSSYYHTDSVIRSGTSALGKLSVALKNISEAEVSASQPYEDVNLDMLMKSVLSSSLLGKANNVLKSTRKNKDESICCTTFYDDVSDHVRYIHGASQPNELNNNKRSQDNVILEENKGSMHEEDVNGSLLMKNEAKRKTGRSGREVKSAKVCIEQIPDHSKNNVVGLSHCLVLSTLQKSPSDLISLSFFFWCARQNEFFHERAAFDHMTNVVERLFLNFGTTKGILHQLEKVGCVVKPQVFLLLLRIVWHGKHYKHVFEVVEEMDYFGCKPNTLGRNIVMDSLFKIDRIDVAMRVLKETQNPNFLTFNVALCNLCKLNDLANIQYVMREMLIKKYYPNARNFSMVLSCYCKKGRLSETLQVLGLMIALGIPISVNIWSILVDGFCKHGKLIIAIDLLDKMVECGYSPNVVTFTPLIKSLLKSQKPSIALDVLHNMESRGCMPDLVLCNVLIDCLSKMHMYDEALDIFFRLRKKNLVPDSYTLSSIISTVCLSQKFTLLPKLINDIPSQYDLPVCNSILGYFCKLGSPSDAVKFYDKMMSTGFVPDAYTYAGLLRGLFGMGWISRAVDVYSAIVTNQYCTDPHIHTIAMNGLIKLGKFDKANRLFQKAAVEKHQLDVVSYTVAIHGLLSSGRTEEAYDLFLLMKDSGVDPNVYTYNIMVSGFCTFKNNEKVEWLLNKMLGAGIPLENNTYQKIRNLLCGSQYSYSVVRLLFKMCDSGLVSKEVRMELLGQEYHPQIDLDERSICLFEPSLMDIKEANASESNIRLDLATSGG